MIFILGIGCGIAITAAVIWAILLFLTKRPDDETILSDPQSYGVAEIREAVERGLKSKRPVMVSLAHEVLSKLHDQDRKARGCAPTAEMKFRGRIFQDGLVVTTVEADDAETVQRELEHYASLYERDGPITVDISCIADRRTPTPATEISPDVIEYSLPE